MDPLLKKLRDVKRRNRKTPDKLLEGIEELENRVDVLENRIKSMLKVDVDVIETLLDCAKKPFNVAEAEKLAKDTLTKTLYGSVPMDTAAKLATAVIVMAERWRST